MAAGHLAFWNRYQHEKNFTRTEIVITYRDIEEISSWAGLPEAETLKRLKQHGLTTVLFKEPTVENLRSKGEALPGAELKWLDNPLIQGLVKANNIRADHTYLIFDNRAAFDRVKKQLVAKLKSLSINTYTGAGTYLIEIPMAYNILKDKNIGLGFPADKIQLVDQAGLYVMVQIRSWSKVSAATVEDLKTVFEPIKNIPRISAVLFNDESVPGYSEHLLPVVAEQIKQTPRATVAVVEFLPQKGLTSLGKLLDKKIIRLHSIAEKEMGKYTPETAIDRFVLAAAERNHRALLVRPFIPVNLASQERFLDRLTAALQQEGLELGEASRFPAVPVSKPVIFLVGLGVIGGGLLLYRRLGFKKGTMPLFAAALVIWAGLLYLQPVLARKLMALAAVMVFPTLSVLIFIDRKERPLGRAVMSLAAMSFLSLVGALLMVGLLADTSFMLKLDQFAGVKLAHVVPLAIAALYFGYLGTTGESPRERISNLLNRPVSWGYAAVAGLLLLAVAVYVVRTGNDGVAVSPLELQFRSMLDNLLGVRPRTKEFLLGHPAMLALLYFGYRDNRFLPLLILGVIGQISLVNTFAHIHTPLVISIIRFGHGLWLGILLGVLAVLIYKAARGGARRYLHG
nr:DUF5693 family protein [Desulforadius tongensis]